MAGAGFRSGVGADRIGATRLTICYRNHHLRRPDTDMDNIRDSFSRFKKDIKHRLKGKKHAPDRAGVDIAGEGIDLSDPLLRPDSHVAASGHDEEGSRTSTDTLQTRSKVGSPQPESIPVDEGGEYSRRREADVGGKEVTQKHSCLDEIALGSGTNRGVSPPPSPSLPPGGGLDSKRPFLLHPLCLLTPPDNADTAETSAATDEKKSNWKSTAFATAKLLLRGVRDSADAFGPLKSAAGGLCFILENCDVRSSPIHSITILRGILAGKGE